MGTKLERIAEMSRKDGKLVFTSLYHLINKELLAECHSELERGKAVGIDGVTKEEYSDDIDAKLDDLELRLKNKSYKPLPARRIYIPKANGKERPLGIMAYEDKIVQLALKKVIEAVYEPRFPSCMYGFRPGRSCHDALKALNRDIERGKTSYILDADIKGFFDNIDHEWMIRCLKEKISDPNIIRLVEKYLKAGIMKNGRYEATEAGSAQGSNLSPLLANIYMYYVLTLWYRKVAQPEMQGESYLTIYADDFIVCFQYKQEAESFLNKLRERLSKFGLEIEPTKTRLIEFGRFAEKNRNKRGEGRPDTFDFLGFTNYCGKSRNGKFRVKRKTSRKKYRASLKNVSTWIQKNRTLDIKTIIQKLNVKLTGYYRYYGVTDNSRMLEQFLREVTRLLFKWLNRRSQSKSYTWPGYHMLLQYVPLNRPKIYVNIYDIS